LPLGNEEVMPATVVRDLGIYIDADVSMRSHVTKTVSGCFAVLRQLHTGVKLLLKGCESSTELMAEIQILVSRQLDQDATLSNTVCPEPSRLC